MNEYIKAGIEGLKRLDVTIYLKPLLHENSHVLSSFDFASETRWYELDGNPCRMVNGDFCYGEELEPRGVEAPRSRKLDN